MIRPRAILAWVPCWLLLLGAIYAAIVGEPLPVPGQRRDQRAGQERARRPVRAESGHIARRPQSRQPASEYPDKGRRARGDTDRGAR